MRLGRKLETIEATSGVFKLSNCVNNVKCGSWMEIDRITEPQEWIDGLLKVYAPNSEDIDVALQNMGLRIKALESALKPFAQMACSESVECDCNNCKARDLLK